jgi:hypothetical protein
MKHLRGGGMQQRRRIGRRYLSFYGWSTLAATCALLALVAERYFAGTLAGNTMLRYVVGIVAGVIISGILILAAKSR